MKKAFIQLHTAVFLAGFTGVLGRLITLNASLIVWYRLLITCIVCWLLILFQKSIPRVPRKQIIRSAAVGFILALHWVSFYAGIKMANVSTGLVCLSAMGFFTAILEPVILRKPFDFVEILLGLMVIAGIGIVFHLDPKYKTGIIVSLFSALLASIFPILNRQIMKNIDPEPATRWQLSGGFLCISLIVPIYLHFLPTQRLLPSLSDWGWLLVLGVVCTVIAFQLFMKALQKIPAFTVNLTYNLEPIYGIALAFLLYREDKEVGPGFYYGFALIITAVILQTMRMKKMSSNAVISHPG